MRVFFICELGHIPPQGAVYYPKQETEKSTTNINNQYETSSDTYKNESAYAPTGEVIESETNYTVTDNTTTTADPYGYPKETSSDTIPYNEIPDTKVEVDSNYVGTEKSANETDTNDENDNGSDNYQKQETSSDKSPILIIPFQKQD